MAGISGVGSGGGMRPMLASAFNFFGSEDAASKGPTQWTKASFFRYLGFLDSSDSIEGHAVDSDMIARRMAEKLNLPYDPEHPEKLLAQPLDYNQVERLMAVSEFGPAFGTKKIDKEGYTTLQRMEKCVLPGDENSVAEKYVVQSSDKSTNKTETMMKTTTVGEFAKKVALSMGGGDDGTGKVVVQPDAFMKRLGGSDLKDFYPDKK